MSLSNDPIQPYMEKRSKFFEIKLKPLDVDLSNGAMISGHAESIEYDTEQKLININYASINRKGDIEMSASQERRMIIQENGEKIDTSIQWDDKQYTDISNRENNPPAKTEPVLDLKKYSGQLLSREIAETKEAISTLKMRLEDLENQAIQSIREGKEVAGFKVVPQFSRIKWTLKDNDVIKLASAYNVVVAKPPKVELITPLQAMKLGMPKEIVKQYSNSEFKSYKLANEGDKPGAEEVNFDDL